jgi:neutral amino acid transport system ATP-binding protein
MSLFEAEQVVSGYGDIEVLHGVSIHVEPGEIVAIIGPNGSGKSTLLKTIFGLAPAHRGTIRFRGREVSRMEPNEIVRLGLSYVPQADNTFLSLTVQENLEMGAFLRSDGLQQRMAEVISMFPDLTRFRHTRVNKLSGGQRQMVAIARAMMLDPIMLLLDEPSAGLSPHFVNVVFDKLGQINQAGITLLLVEQNAQRALEMANRGYVFASGEVRYENEASKILSNEEIGRLYLGR